MAFTMYASEMETRARVAIDPDAAWAAVMGRDGHRDGTFVYAVTTTNSAPQISGTGVTKVVATGTSTGVFTTPVTGLTYGTGYSYAAYAINSSGAGYSSVGSFTTPTPGKAAANGPNCRDRRKD